ncbi:hypothetical protein [Streptomyces sp. NBC_01358]|uniref:hypothetical protein n=1 Tax=Streptomyces sp. NBC_01358 TaxID=2903837 RepID=UPI002E338BEE|nr:hypothetical protein [Streptomyces sp. NBC_01358]
MTTTGAVAETDSGGTGRPVAAADAGHTARTRGQVHWAPFRSTERSAVAAIDLLRRLAAEGGGGRAPAPREPEVVRFLGATHRTHWPAATGCPDWLTESWAACGFPERDPRGPRPERIPDRAEVLEQLRFETDRTSRGLTGSRKAAAIATWLSPFYLGGIVTAAEVLEVLPARLSMPVRVKWQASRVRHAIERELWTLLTGVLGTDPQAWLRLLTAVERTCRPTSDRPDITWPQLLELAGSVEPDPGILLPTRDLEDPRTYVRRGRSKPAADELFDATWWWPSGEVLRRTESAVLDLVMPALPEGTGVLLAQYVVAVRHGTPPGVLRHLMDAGDREALLVLARGMDLDGRTAERLLARGDQDIHLSVVNTWARVAPDQRHQALTDPAVDLAPRVSEIISLVHHECLQAREPELIEAAFAGHGQKKFKVQEHLTGCLALLRAGGPARLTALLATGRVSPAVSRICAKALTAPDPAAALRTRAQREFTTPKLVARLRRVSRSSGATDTAQLMLLFDGWGADWPYLEAEHAREPFAHWAQIVNRPSTPPEVLARHSDAAAQDHQRGRTVCRSDDPVVARGILRNGIRYGSTPDGHVDLLDRMLAEGVITADDLVRVAGRGPCVLQYLGDARHRADAPGAVAEVLARVAVLVGRHLPVDDEAAWHRLYARLAAQSPDPLQEGTIESVLTAGPEDRQPRGAVS